MEARMKKPTVIGIIILLVLLGFFAPSADAVEVDIPDPGLEAAIREALGIPTDPITDTDLAVPIVLYADSREITDLTGLEYCVNLSYLSLGNNNIRDISALSGLTNLEWLYLYDNNIRDIDALSGLTNLETKLEGLWLDRNNIRDINVLSELTNLRILSLWDNNIRDISTLSELTNLEGLWLSSNNISDISALSELTDLERLHLNRNNISDISALSELIKLEGLYLSFNNISDIQPLVDNSGLATDDWVDLRGNPLSDKAIDTDIPELQGRGVTVYVYTSVEDLIAVVEGWDLPEGTGNTLIARLRAANRAFDGNWQITVKHMYAFIDQCEKMRGTKLTDQQADYLIAEATEIIED